MQRSRQFFGGVKQVGWVVVICVVTPRDPVDCCQCCGERCCHHLEGSSSSYPPFTTYQNGTVHSPEHQNPIYEGWNFNSGNYLFATDTKQKHVSKFYCPSVQSPDNPLPAMWKSQDTFSSVCCVDSSNGAVYRLKNLWNSSEANATQWFLHLRNQVEVTRA